jgi:hypothetical protein
MGFWKEQGIDIRVAIKADDEELFATTRQMFKQTGKYSVDFLACRAGDLAFQRATGLEIEPIAAIADDLTDTVLVGKADLAGVQALKGESVACDLRVAKWMRSY